MGLLRGGSSVPFTRAGEHVVNYHTFWTGCFLQLKLSGPILDTLVNRSQAGSMNVLSFWTRLRGSYSMPSPCWRRPPRGGSLVVYLVC